MPINVQKQSPGVIGIHCPLFPPDPSNTFPLQSYVHFSEDNTRSSTHLKLMHSLCKSTLHVTCISTNFHGSGTINLFLTIRNQVLEAFWSHFESHFLSTNPCTFHYNYLPMFCVCLFINYSNTLLVFHQYKSQSLYACPFLLFLSLSSCIYCEAKGEKKKKVWYNEVQQACCCHKLQQDWLGDARLDQANWLLYWTSLLQACLFFKGSAVGVS